MKPIVRAVPALVLLLVLLPVSLYAISVFDVIRLTQEKYSDQEIIKVIQVTDSRFVLTAEDTTRLKKEGVRESVIREMLSRPAREKGTTPPAQSAPKASKPSSAASKDSRKDVPADARTQPRDPASVLDEIVRLTKAGLSDETVLVYVKAHRGELPAVVPSDRLVWLRESGVSQAVILYLTAIDVRASEGDVQDATYSSQEGASYPVPAYSSPGYGDDVGYYDGSTYASYPVDASYPVSDYASYYGDYPFYVGYSYPYYPYYPYYPAYFFVDSSGFFGRGHHHGHGHDGHDGHGHHGGDGHHHGSGHEGSPGDRPGGNGHGGFRGNGGNVTTSQAWRERPALARGSFTQASRQPRGDLVLRGGPGRSPMPSRGLDRVSRGSGGPGVVSRPGFSGGGARPGAMVGRAPISRPGGGSGAISRPTFSGGGGGRAGASVGRAPIARSGGGASGGMGRSGGGGRGR